MTASLVLMSLAAGDSVDDLRVPEKDEGCFGALRKEETYRMRRKEHADCLFVID